jgi:DNA polymerase/3'-5' exonuclease PolX
MGIEIATPPDSPSLFGMARNDSNYFLVGEMTNAEIAAVFTSIAAMLRVKKENIFKIRAYEKVARSILELNEPVENMVKENRINEIPGAGEAITKKLTELVNTGRLAFYEKLKLEMKPAADGADPPARSRS